MKNLSSGHSSNGMRLNAIEQEADEGVRLPRGVVYQNEESTNVQSTSSENATVSGMTDGSSMEFSRQLMF